MSKSPISVLVADAQVLFSQALGVVLSKMPGVTVLDERPRSGVDAVNAAATRKPDVAVVDPWLRDLGGVAATRLIRAHTPRVNVVVLAWFHGADEVQQAYDAGAVAVLAKSVRAEEVAQAIREAATVTPPSHAETAADAVGATDGANANGADPSGQDDTVWRRLDTLTPRELETLRLMAAGLPKEDIADRLGVSQETARTHVNRLLAKTETHTQLNAVAVAHRHGVVR